MSLNLSYYRQCYLFYVSKLNTFAYVFLESIILILQSDTLVVLKTVTTVPIFRKL